jgi:flagellar biosynthesis protein FlhF
VGLITIDTYRIGAVEQLRTYAEITGMPIEVVMTPKDMSRALDRLADRELILIDTAGRNSKNSLHVSELASFLTLLPSSETFLVISATTKMKDLKVIIENFRKANFNRLIFTKLDETESYGALLNVACQIGLPLTYVTTGQNVPDDLEAANAEKLAKLILGVEQHA